MEKEKEEARKEEGQLTNNIRDEIQNIKSEINENEKRLEAVIEELEALKLREANALAETVVRERASKKNSTITISKFEYEYLTGCAAEARELTDKKVAAAANAWAEAWMADEKE